MEKPKHGGRRQNAGRRIEIVGEQAHKSTVSLDDMTKRKLIVVGGGNISKGIRVAAAPAYDAYQNGRLIVDTNSTPSAASGEPAA